MTEQPEVAYERGHLAGEIAARLANHDRHFDRINGSIEKTAAALIALEKATQRLADEAKASAATVIATAEALEKADVARRDKSEQRWSPHARTIAVIGAVAAVLGVGLAIYLRLGGH